jgi:hypothetical protein
METLLLGLAWLVRELVTCRLCHMVDYFCDTIRLNCTLASPRVDQLRRGGRDE